MAVDKSYNQVLKDFVKVFKKSINDFARAYENPKVHKDTLSSSDLVKSLKVELVDEQLTISIFDYYKYIESGRKKGAKMIPVSVLIQWIKKKGIANFNKRLRNKEKVANESARVNRIAWAIAKSIKLKRILKRPFLSDALQSSILEFDELFTKRTEKILNQMLKEFKEK